MMDKAIESLPSYSNVKKCATIILQMPLLSSNQFYLTRRKVLFLYGDLNVKIYQSRSDNETNPDNFIKKMKISLWKVVKFDKVTWIIM